MGVSVFKRKYRLGCEHVTKLTAQALPIAHAREKNYRTQFKHLVVLPPVSTKNLWFLDGDEMHWACSALVTGRPSIAVLGVAQYKWITENFLCEVKPDFFKTIFGLNKLFELCRNKTIWKRDEEKCIHFTNIQHWIQEKEANLQILCLWIVYNNKIASSNERVSSSRFASTYIARTTCVCPHLIKLLVSQTVCPRNPRFCMVSCRVLKTVDNNNMAKLNL